MFIMSGDSTKEWERYLLAGSRGSSILKEPAALERLPSTSTSPRKNAANPPLLCAKRPSPVVVLTAATPDPKSLWETPSTPSGPNPVAESCVPKLSPKMPCPLLPVDKAFTPKPPPLLTPVTPDPNSLWAMPSTPSGPNPPEFCVPKLSPQTPCPLLPSAQPVTP